MATSNSDDEAVTAGNQRPRRSALILWLVVSQLALLVALFPWLGAAMMSLLAFDSGVTSEAMIFVAMMWSFPVLAIVFVIAAWTSFKYQKNRLAAILTGLPLIPPLILFFIINMPHSV